MNGLHSLHRRIDKLTSAMEQQQGPQEVIFETRWGDDPLFDDGTEGFITEWGGGALDGDEEDSDT